MLARLRRFQWINFVIGLGFAIVTVLVWAAWNRPTLEPPWPREVSGLSFSPLRAGNDPAAGEFPSVEEIAGDLALLAGKTRSIRTYGVGATLGEIPGLARRHGMSVTLGAWLSGNRDSDAEEIGRLIDVARANRNVVRVIVGNETILRGDLAPADLAVYMDAVRTALKIPVSTGEPWHVWLKYPELVAHSDFIAAHMLPYWEGIPLDRAVEQVVQSHQSLQRVFPGKPVVFAEVGWPSNGRTIRSAVANEANEAIFLRRFLARAQHEGFDYYLMEAFDQPWKSDTEGAVGAYWGVYDVYRNPKFAFVEPIVRVPEWRTLAGITVVLGVMGLTMLLLDGAALQGRGRGFLAAMANSAAAGIVWIGYVYANQYLTPLTVGVGVMLGLAFAGVVVVLLTEAHEMAEASWITRRRRLFTPAACPRASEDCLLPKVSIHVPAYNEPPDMLIESLNSLARLDYPSYEVLVIDNNTRDPAVWKPVEAHCRRLGARFRFFHEGDLAGFKAGALNYALERTAPDAEIVAVIDSDYQVRPEWLRDLVPHFARPEIGIVQAPQDYRDERESLFKNMCYAEYKGFFHIGMVTRNDRNAIIEHGTMTMIRTTALQNVGGWGEWCITEDAELGLKILEHGYEAAYVEESYGKGLMPDSLLNYKKQRFRWAYGAAQILKRHAGQFMNRMPSRLTPGQRYHFIAGWLPWLADGLNLFFTAAALAWSLLIVLDPKHVDPPLAVFTLPPLALFGFKVVKLIYLYRRRVHATVSETGYAALAGLALSHTIAKAMILGLVTSERPFFRTPKCEDRPALVRALVHSAEETVIAGALWLAALGVGITQGPDLPGALLWAAALVVQSVPYLAALVLALTTVVPPAWRRKPSNLLPEHPASSRA